MNTFNLKDSEGNFRVYVKNGKLYKQYECDDELFDCMPEVIREEPVRCTIYEAIEIAEEIKNKSVTKFNLYIKLGKIMYSEKLNVYYYYI